MSDSRFRYKCRTCKYLAMADGSSSSGYCYQTDDYIKLEEFHGSKIMDADRGCSEGWEPTFMLAPLFHENFDRIAYTLKEGE